MGRKTIADRVRNAAAKMSWDNLKFPLILTGIGAAGSVANEYYLPAYMTEFAGVIKQYSGELGYNYAVPAVERFLAYSALGTPIIRSWENAFKKDNSGLVERTKKLGRRFAIAGLIGAAVIPQVPKNIGKAPEIIKTVSDFEAEMRSSEYVKKSIEKLTSEKIMRYDKARKPVSFRQDLIERVEGALRDRNHHYKAIENARALYPDIKKYDKFDHFLTIALTAQESGGNPYATSKSGARGVAQLMPGTAKDHGMTMSGKVDDSRDPYLAIMAEVDYLARLILQFKSIELGIASYNAGPGTTQNAQKKYGPGSFWKTLGGYKQETQLYVPEVLATRQLLMNQDENGIRFEPKNAQLAGCSRGFKNPREQSRDAVARILDIDPYDITRCNPALRQKIVPRNYVVKHP